MIRDRHPVPWSALIVAGCALALMAIAPDVAYADDCTRDPFNAADCMRTGGFRETIAVFVSLGAALATVLVNILSGISIAPPPAAPPAVTPAAPPPAAPPTIPAAPPPAAPPAAPPPIPAAPPQRDWPKVAEDFVASGTESSLFDLIKNLTGPGATVVGSLSEFFTFPDRAEVIEAIRKARDAWHANPGKATGDAYRKAIQEINDLRLKKWSDRLDYASKFVDVIDAVGSGLRKAEERGFTGIDKYLTIGAELGKKRLAWALTKNPAVGLVDAALGGATEMIWGKEGRVDIGSCIDKGADAWDRTTQEYFSNTQGQIAADADIQTQDQFLHGLRRIKDQVARGEISREEGIARIHRLRSRMFGG